MLRIATLLLVAHVGVCGSRTTVSLDFGWRTLPASPQACSAASFVVSLANTTLSGWTPTNVPGAAVSPAACAAAACAADVLAFAYCAADAPCAVGGRPACVIGPSAQFMQVPHWTSSGEVNTTGWVASQRAVAVPPAGAAEAARAFDDSSWVVVDLPHDASAEAPVYRNTSSEGEGFIGVQDTWYRKAFAVPAAWAAGTAVTLVVDGALTTSSWWLNGVNIVPIKRDGYLPLELRLDLLNLTYGGGPNVLVAWTTNSATTGWWAEGSGIVGHAALIATPSQAYLPPSAISAPAFLSGAVHSRATPADGLWSDAALLAPSASVAAAASARISLTFEVFADGGATLVNATSVTATVAGGGGPTTIAGPLLALAAPELWSVPRPYLYMLRTTLRLGGQALDSVNESIGLRQLDWTGSAGLAVNGQPVKMRGACNHMSFAGVGAAIPDRVDLLRLQQLRGAGGNAWRTSHAPPEPVLLRLTDRLGVLVLDENRVFATVENCEGECNYVPSYAGSVPADMANLARRDRNHASVAFYSLCNELGCGPASLLANQTAVATKAAVLEVDGSRAITANNGWQGKDATAPNTPLSALLDVMGMSHQPPAVVTAFHVAEPFKPLVMSECCSCETQRGEDADQPLNASRAVYFSDEASACLGEQTQWSNAPPFVAGSFVWTMHDYIGEPGAFPHVSSSFGAFDLAGLPKAAAWWYRAWWLADIAGSDAGRPPLPGTAVFCRLVEAWAPGVSGVRNLTVYTNAPLARLLVNGAPVGAPVPVPRYGAAAFRGVAFAPGTATAQALAADGVTVLASHAVHSWGAPAALALSVDAPSAATGTGAALFLDGRDAALVRATVLDADGRVVRDAAVNVTFFVTVGPGLVWATHNGDPAERGAPHAAWKPTYHGLARAVVRVTLAAAGADAERALLAAVNLEAGAGPRASAIAPSGAGAPPTSITVTAEAPGVAGASIRIPLSVDPADEVLAVAARSVAAADVGE